MTIRIKHQPRGGKMAYFCPVCTRPEFSAKEILCHINKFHKGYWIAHKEEIKT